MTHIWLRLLWLSLCLLILALLSLIALGWYVRATTRPYRYHNPTIVPDRPAALIFGAGVWADGTPTPMLADRVKAGVTLYHQQRIRRLIMSGDNQHPDYNEVDAMRRLAENLGVPPDAIAVDRLGLNTYASCTRAQRNFGYDRLILVTQHYHLPRAVYICRRLGVEAIGLGVNDWGVYRYRSMVEFDTPSVNC